jgi:hypothetical protein
MDVKEDNVRQCRIVIFLDNSSDEKALALKKEIEKMSKSNKLIFRKALFTIFYLVRHYDIRLTSPGFHNIFCFKFKLELL